MRVSRFDKFKFSGAPPSVQLLLSFDGGAYVRGLLEVHEFFQTVPFGKAIDQTEAMFIDPFFQVARDTDVQCLRRVGHDVNSTVHCADRSLHVTGQVRRKLATPRRICAAAGLLVRAEGGHDNEYQIVGA